jgi:hypothetical protein
MHDVCTLYCMYIQYIFFSGVYCAVLGQLQKAGNEPIVSAMKMTAIPESNALKKMWPVEVTELKKFLNGSIIPSLEMQ